MIALTAPITIAPAPVSGKPIKPTTLTSIDYSVSYDNSRQVATARLKGVNASLVLWDQHTTPPYSSVGQFSDSDTDARISDLLSVKNGTSAIQTAILALFPAPAKIRAVPVK